MRRLVLYKGKMRHLVLYKGEMRRLVLYKGKKRHLVFLKGLNEMVLFYIRVKWNCLVLYKGKMRCLVLTLIKNIYIIENMRLTDIEKYFQDKPGLHRTSIKNQPKYMYYRKFRSLLCINKAE